MADLFSQQGRRRLKKDFLGFFGASETRKVNDNEFERYVSRFNAAATGVGNLHSKLKDFIRAQEELSIASASVLGSLTSLTSSTAGGGLERQELRAQLKNCTKAQELQSQTVFLPAKKNSM